MALYDDLNRAGLLAIGLTPTWYDLASVAGVPPAADNGAPDNANAGQQMLDSPRVLVAVQLREAVHRRTARVEITAYDLTTTVYTATFDGATAVYDAAVETPADNAALLSGLVDRINSTPGTSAVVTASIDPSNADTILIVGDSEANYSIDYTAAGGAGAVTVTADATSAGARLWATARTLYVASGSDGPAIGDWFAVLDGDYSGITYRGLVERIDFAGLDRLYVELYSVDGDASDGAAVRVTAAVFAGPATLDGTATA